MQYEIKRTDRRTVAITVKDGKVILRAPKKLSDREAEKIINAHTEWINKKLEAFEKKKAAEVPLTDNDIAVLKRPQENIFQTKPNTIRK